MLRCIAEGALDDGSVADLAARLGLGPRQLTRLCERHLGTTPVRLAQTRRVHFARALIEQSALPLSQVALAAGFGSLRRFNALMKATYGCAPGDLRRRKSMDDADARGGAVGAATATCAGASP
jgi:AraC family transcriptional regulator of adaptative response / DNA-3-methyladenine glycosylase II